MPESGKTEFNFADDIFNQIRLNDRASHIGKYITDYTPRLIQQLTANGKGIHLPTEAWHILTQLIRLHGIINISVKMESFLKTDCERLCEQTLKALSNIYNPDKPDLLPADEQTIRLLCAPIQSSFSDHLRSINASRKMLFSAVPGRKHSDKIKFVEQTDASLAEELGNLLDEMDKDEQRTNRLFHECKEIRHLCLRGLLLHTSLFERAIDKGSKVIANICIDFWQEDPDSMEKFLHSSNFYLTQKAGQSHRVGYDCILENNTFANLIQRFLPVSCWSPATAMAIGFNAFHKGVPVTTMRTFLKNIALLPDDKYKLYMNDFLDAAFDVFAFCEQTPDEEEKERYDSKNLIPFITHISDASLSDQVASFLNARPLSFIQNMLDQPIDSLQYKSIVSFFLKTPEGQSRLPMLKTQDGRNLVWTLYATESIEPTDMDQLIHRAIASNDHPFLMSSKKSALTKNLPGYDQLTHYFRNSPLAIQFIDSFASPQQDPGTRFSLIQDFIDDTTQLKQVALQSHLIPFWAKRDAVSKIISFFYNGDPNRVTELTPRLPLEDMALLLVQKDEDEKTAWHYFCERKNRLLFGRFFKKLYPSFLQVAQQPDRNGCTPIDYMADNLKFRQVIVEKIPIVEQLITQHGLSLKHEKPVKSVNIEETPVTPAHKVEVSIPSPPPHEPAEWVIMELGNDKERKDMFYQALIRRAIKVLPPPQSESVNITNSVMVKKTPLGTSTFKIWHNNTQWRIPFVKDDRSGIIYILPGSDRSDTYSNKDYCRIVRNYVKKINQRKKNNRQRE